MATNTNITFVDYVTPIPASWLNNVNTVVNDIVDVKTFGALGNGVHDDTANIQAAINSLPAGGTLNLPLGNYRVSAPLIINNAGIQIRGSGMFGSYLTPLTNFSGGVLQFQGSASYCGVNELNINTTGTTTQCVVFKQNSVVIRFSKCYFQGDLTGDLVYSTGQNIDFDRCTWQLSGSNTWGINFDCFNQNVGVSDCRFGGPGNGLRVTNVASPSDQQQGLRINNTYFVNTGSYNVWLGNSFFTTITGSVLDQSTVHALHLDPQASGVVVSNCYFGSHVSTGVNIYCGENTIDIQLNNNSHGFGSYGVVAHATASAQVNGLTINNCNFGLVTTGTPLLLDSVQNFSATGNLDRAGTTNGSWNTLRTNPSGGTYNFANNIWAPFVPVLYDSSSPTNFVNERGIVGRKGGTANPGAATSSFTVAHGCSLTPNRVVVTPYGGAGDVWVTNITSTTFTINWSSGSAVTAWFWEADCSH